MRQTVELGKLNTDKNCTENGSHKECLRVGPILLRKETFISSKQTNSLTPIDLLAFILAGRLRSS